MNASALCLKHHRVSLENNCTSLYGISFAKNATFLPLSHSFFPLPASHSQKCNSNSFCQKPFPTIPKIWCSSGVDDEPQIDLRADEKTFSSSDNASGSRIENQKKIIGGKYEIIGILGRGGNGIMYEALTPEKERVAIKSLSLFNMNDWKSLELFEREAKVLRALKHPSIPEYVDYLEEDEKDDKKFYLIQKVAEGKNLSQLVLKEGIRFSENKIIDILLQVLDILSYLESLRPPVIHRDIKPENLIYDEISGKVQLVDFGAVQERVYFTVMGNTMIGTYGYMSPEQFQNKCSSASDLYSLGATALFLLSGRNPSEFPQKRLSVDFIPYVPMSLPLQKVLFKLLQPAPEDRYRSAAEVTRDLKQILSKQNFKKEMATTGNQTLQSDWKSSQEGKFWGVQEKEREREKEAMSMYSPETFISKSEQVIKPESTKVVLEKIGSELYISIPPLGVNPSTIGSSSFAIAWNAFIAFWTASAITAGAPLLFTAFSIPFWFTGAGLAKNELFKLAISTTLQIRPSSFSAKYCFGNDLFNFFDEGGRISAAKLILEESRNRQPLSAVELTTANGKSFQFGAGLTLSENKWLKSEILHFLEIPESQNTDDVFLRLPPKDRRSKFDENYWEN